MIYASPDALADLLQLSRRTVYRWLADGRIPSVKLGRLVRINVPDALRALGLEDEAPRPIRNRVKAEREALAARALLAGGGKTKAAGETFPPTASTMDLEECTKKN